VKINNTLHKRGGQGPETQAAMVLPHLKKHFCLNKKRSRRLLYFYKKTYCFSFFWNVWIIIPQIKKTFFGLRFIYQTAHRRQQSSPTQLNKNRLVYFLAAFDLFFRLPQQALEKTDPA